MGLCATIAPCRTPPRRQGPTTDSYPHYWRSGHIPDVACSAAARLGVLTAAPILQKVHGPSEFRRCEYCPPARARSFGAFGPTNSQRAVVAVARNVWIGPEVGEVQHDELGPSKPVGISDLECGRVTKRGQQRLDPLRCASSTKSSTTSNKCCNSALGRLAASAARHRRWCVAECSTRSKSETEHRRTASRRTQPIRIYRH